MEESEKKLNEQDGQNKTNIEWGGWDKTSNRPIDYTNGIINIRIKPKLGSFCFYVINEDEKHIPVMSTTNEYVLSSFYLKAGKKVYKLNDSKYQKRKLKSFKKTETKTQRKKEVEKTIEEEANSEYFQERCFF